MFEEGKHVMKKMDELTEERSTRLYGKTKFNLNLKYKLDQMDPSFLKFLSQNDAALTSLSRCYKRSIRFQYNLDSIIFPYFKLRKCRLIYQIPVWIWMWEMQWRYKMKYQNLNGSSSSTKRLVGKLKWFLCLSHQFQCYSRHHRKSCSLFTYHGGEVRHWH